MEVSGALVVAGSASAEVLRLGEEPFGQGALAVELLAEARLPASVALGWNVGRGALVLDQLTNSIGIMGLVRQDDGARPRWLSSVSAICPSCCLPGGQTEPDWGHLRVNDDVDLGREPAARSAKTMICISFFFAVEACSGHSSSSLLSARWAEGPESCPHLSFPWRIPCGTEGQQHGRNAKRHKRAAPACAQSGAVLIGVRSYAPSPVRECEVRKPVMRKGAGRNTLWERLFKLEAVLTLCVAWVLVFKTPFHLTARLFGGVRPLVAPNPVDGALSTADLTRARMVGRNLADRAARLPWKSTCLVRAIACRLMLVRRGIPGRVILGVAINDGGTEAHAWLMTGDEVVIGGEEASQFKAFSYF